MKKWIVILVLMISGFAFARTSYWGEYEDEMIENLRRPDRVVADFTVVLSLAVDEIVNDANWTGTRKEAHDLFRNYIASQMNVSPPVNWDANVTNAQDARIDFINFLNTIIVNNQTLTEDSKLLILNFAEANVDFE